MEKMKVSFNIDRELYAEYKKVMIDLKTTPTADLYRYIDFVVNDPENSATAKAKKEEEENNA
jgi:hypothetical protein